MNIFRAVCQSRSATVTQTLRRSGILNQGQELIDFLRINKMADHDETLFGVFSRATQHLAQAGVRFYGTPQVERHRQAFLHQVVTSQVILGSPMLTNAGRRDGKSISACSIPPLRLSKMSREQIAKMVGDYHTRGMGTGFCFDDLADPVSMVIFLNDMAVKEVQQGKIERSCSNMGMLSVDHPRVLDFIRIKKENPTIREWKFNISVNMTNAFMSAWENKTLFTLKDGTQVEPEYLMYEIAKNAHATGDPGVIFMDRMNQLNRVPQLGTLEAVVPCGEVSMFDGEVCQFAYLNLPRFVKNKTIDQEALKTAVRTIVTLLDNAVEANIDTMPTEESRKMVSSIRRIGVGVCGFSEMLHALGLPYDSQEGRDLALDVMSLINFESKNASITLAEDRGPFPYFHTEGTRKELFIQPFSRHPSSFVTGDDWEWLEARFQKLGIRNISTTILPPSGRSSLLGGVTGSIEPPFRLVADQAFKDALQRECEKHGYSGNFKSIYEHVEQTGSVQETDLPSEVKEVFKCALELTPHAHMKMTSVFQRHVDEGISKTINLPSSATIQDVEHVFGTCFQYGLKGMTIYRDGSRTLQPKSLNTKKESAMIQTLYGPIQVSTKIAGLLETPLVRRLKGIRQNGVAYLIDPRQSTSRYDHSLGVLSLAQLLGASESEQIAALLHDISHAAFSHLADLVFAHKMQDFHEVVRERFLDSEDAKKTCDSFGLSIKELNCHDLPLVKGKRLNVDRLDYCIRDLLAVGRIFQPEYAAIVHNLVVDESGEIRCKDLDTARLIFRKFIEVNKEVYFDPKVEAASLAVTVVLQRMLKNGMLSEGDFFKTDDHLLEKIAHSPYKGVLEQVGPNMPFSVSQTPTKLPPVIRKLRYIDPILVGLEGPLTHHCPDSKEFLEEYLKTNTTLHYHIPMVEHLC